MARVDIKKLVAMIHYLEEGQREHQCNTDELTELYSFRAHLRGRLHMTKREVNKYYVPKGAKVLEERPHAHLIEWNMALQEKMVEGCWKRFELDTHKDEETVQLYQETVIELH